MTGSEVPTKAPFGDITSNHSAVPPSQGLCQLEDASWGSWEGGTSFRSRQSGRGVRNDKHCGETVAPGIWCAGLTLLAWPAPSPGPSPFPLGGRHRLSPRTHRGTSPHPWPLSPLWVGFPKCQCRLDQTRPLVKRERTQSCPGWGWRPPQGTGLVCPSHWTPGGLGTVPSPPCPLQWRTPCGPAGGGPESDGRNGNFIPTPLPAFPETTFQLELNLGDLNPVAGSAPGGAQMTSLHSCGLELPRLAAEKLDWSNGRAAPPASGPPGRASSGSAGAATASCLHVLVVSPSAACSTARS